MEAERFDALTSGLAAGEAPRRGMLVGLSAGALAALVGHLTADEAEAKKKGKKRKKKKKKKPVCKRCPKICESPHTVFCKPLTDLEAEQCVCARKTNGQAACVNAAGPAFECVPDNECEDDGDCGANEVCIRVDGGNCCTGEGQGTGNQCLPECDV